MSRGHQLPVFHPSRSGLQCTPSLGVGTWCILHVFCVDLLKGTSKQSAMETRELVAWGAVNDNRPLAGQLWLSPKIGFWFFINGHGKPRTAVRQFNNYIPIHVKMPALTIIPLTRAMISVEITGSDGFAHSTE
ncbi:hypothetical protein B0H13DRAFT_2361457 [Mycena leptocephala]|nr:hypothetical protein B0H13DRAFT_2361457 [Mycena leptocephala]